MVRGYHIILTTYGFWLPNDPRGSWSKFIRAWELLHFGPATKTDSRRSVAHKPHDHQQRQITKRSLERNLVSFSGQQALSVAKGFKQAIERSGFRFYACAILPEHVHAVLPRCRYKIEYVMGQLKGEATKQLRRDGLDPGGHLPDARSPWSQRSGWKAFLNTSDEIRRAIQYVEMNPIKEGKPAQHWSFVESFVE